MSSIEIKDHQAVQIMAEGGHRLALTMEEVLKQVKPGLILSELDKFAEAKLRQQKGKPSFKMVPGYRYASCLNLNEGVVHGVPGSQVLKSGDLLSVDLGLFYQGYHTDMARTIIVGDVKEKEKQRLIDSGKAVLEKTINVCRSGNFVGHLSMTIEQGLGEKGFCPVKDLTGHGVGKKLHEGPSIPCFLEGSIEKTALLKPGMTLAIEVIYTTKPTRLSIADDDWTVQAANGILAGLFEDTVLVTDEDCQVLTQ